MVSESVEPLARPFPLGLELSDGDRCRLRNGGSWSSPRQHPDWFGWYECQKHDAVWAPSATTVFDTGERQWTVEVGDVEGRMVTRHVLRAYYVTAAK